MDQAEPIGPTSDDPEILALLDFAPVVRKNERHDGWTPEHQRGLIIALALTGNIERAAAAVGRTKGGAWALRFGENAEGFCAAWAAALALYHRRRCVAVPEPAPEPMPAPAPAHRPGRGRRGPAPPPAPDPPDEGDWNELLDGLIARYLRKLADERCCRLAGRIVAADFYVRQLTWIEVALDIGGRAQDVLDLLRIGDVGVTNIVATPMSALLDQVRRDFWREKGEPDRPAPPPLGEHDEERSLGVPSYFSPPRDGDYKDWCRRQDAAQAVAAEAQAAWEERAKAEAGAWRARAEGAGEADAAEAGGAEAGEP
jgi:hypothetical protein